MPVPAMPSPLRSHSDTCPAAHRRGPALWCVAGTVLMLPALALAQTSFAPSFSEYSASTTVSQLRIRGVHSKGVLGQGVTVALLDTGLNLANPEFLNNPRVLTPYNAVDGSADVTDSIKHGTHVAGIIAAGGNGTGMYGVAPQAKLLMVKVFNGGTASASDINRGLDYAIAHGARVVNMSFGTTTPLGDSGLRRAAATNQAVLVAAAGNESSRNPNWPGHYAREAWAGGTMLVVGAVDSNNRLASFSNRAGDTAQFYLVAPGVNIYSSYDTWYGYMSGTSMAAPAVSGAAALVTGYWPYLRANQVAAILLNTADDLGAPGVDAVYGHGMLNVNRALMPVGSYTYRSANGYTVTVPLSVQGLASRQPAAVTPSAFRGLQTEVFDAYGRNFTSDEGASLAVRTVLTSEMVMGTGPEALSVNQRVGLDGARLTLWHTGDAQAASPLRQLGGPGVMSPLSAGVAPGRPDWSTQPQGSGAMRWQNREGWGLSLGDGGLSGLSLGLMAGGLDASTGGAPDALTQVTGSPLASFAPAHRFAVLTLPLGDARDPADHGVWHARLAALRPDVPGHQRSAQGSVNLGEVGYEHGRLALNVSLGQLNEDGLLGGYSSQALGLDASHRTRGLSLSGAWRLNTQWAATASWSQTLTSAPTASGLLVSGSSVRANAHGLGLSGRSLWQADDHLSLAWLMPLKASSGQLRYSVVTGVDDAGQPLYGEQTVNLGEGSREWQADARYQWRSGLPGFWTAAMTLRVHPDHDASAPAQWAGGVRYQQAF